MNDTVPPAHRIAGRLTNWERDIPHLTHYAKQVGNTRLERRIARLATEINQTLAEARAAAENEDEQSC